MRAIKLTIYTFSHFIVDFACFFFLYAFFWTKIGITEYIAIGFLLYNVIAFGTQSIFGYLADQNKLRHPAIWGIALVILALSMSEFGFLSLIIISFGNSLFHTGAGKDVLENSKLNIKDSGIFVSSGALGVAFGILFGKDAPHLILFILSLLLISVLLIVTANYYGKKYKFKSINVNDNIVKKPIITNKLNWGTILILLVVAIIVRSFVGGILKMPSNTSAYTFLFPAFAAFLGKFLGGFFADIFGAKKVAIISLSLSLMLLVLLPDSLSAFLFAIMLFNFAMPITLWGVYSVLCNNAGLAFGITTVGLLIGVIPTYFFAISKQSSVVLTIILIIIAIICLFLSLTNKKTTRS